MKNFTWHKKAKVSGGDLPNGYYTPEFELIFVNNLTEKQINDEVFSSLKIKFYNVIRAMGKEAAEKYLKDCEYKVTIFASEAGRQVRSPEVIFEETKASVANLTPEQKAQLIAELTGKN